jgi:tetratricopeptide (TPR) repeat protein
MLFKQKRYDEALIHFRTVMRLDPLMPQAPLAAGRVHLRQGRFEQAIEEFQTALSIDPTLPQPYRGIGQVLIKQQKYDEAIQQLRQAQRLDPQLISVRLQIAQIYQRQGKLAEALSEVQSALNIAPKEWRTYQALGRLYLRREEYNAAIEAFRDVIKLNPEVRPGTRLGLVKALTEDNHLDEAVEILQQVPKSKALEPRKHKLWGDIYQRQGLLKEAAEEYQAASLLAAEQGNTLEDLASVDALLEEEEEQWEEVLETYSAAAEQRIADAQKRRFDDIRSRRTGGKS